MSFIEYLKEDMSDIEKRKDDLDIKRVAWQKQKQDLIVSIKAYTEEIEEALGKIESGIDYTGNIQSDLDALKEIFEKIRETDSDLEREASDLEVDEDELKQG